MPKASPDARKEVARIARQLDHLKALNIEPSALDAVQRQFRELRQFENLIKDTDLLRTIRETLKSVEDAGGLPALQEATKQMNSFRNALAHAGIDVDRPSLPRPAYRLDEDNDE